MRVLSAVQVAHVAPRQIVTIKCDGFVTLAEPINAPLCRLDLHQTRKDITEDWQSNDGPTRHGFNPTLHSGAWDCPVALVGTRPTTGMPYE